MLYSQYAILFFEHFRSPVAQLVEHVAVHEARSAECKTQYVAREHEERRWQ